MPASATLFGARLRLSPGSKRGANGDSSPENSGARPADRSFDRPALGGALAMTSINPETLEVPARGADISTATQTHEVSVCICTLRRGELLLRLLRSLENQRTGGLFKYSVVVADNDGGKSAQ